MRTWFMILLTVSSTFGQARAPKPQFEAISLAINISGEADGYGQISPKDRLEVINIPAQELIKLAFGIRDEAIVGAPNWVETQRYDITGKGPTVDSEEVFWRSSSQVGAMKLPYSSDEFRLMMQSLLADRFKFASHQEKRQSRVYALLPASGGPKLQKAASVGKPKCSRTVDRQVHAELSCKNLRSSDLARALQVFAPAYADKDIIDSTGLNERYDIVLNWVGRANVDQGGDSLPVALQKQLGLRLEERNVALPVIIVDHMEKPSVK